MNKRYDDTLVIKEATENVAFLDPDNTTKVPQDIVIEFIDSILGNPVISPENRLSRFYQMDQITQPLAVGMIGAVKGSMFDAIWSALGQPANGVTNVLWQDTQLPRWHVRFETTDKLVRIRSLNLRQDYIRFLVGLINERFRERAGTAEITHLSVEQHEHFIMRINEALTNL